MKKFKSEMKQHEIYEKSLHALGIPSPGRVCYFDIETTGLSKRSSVIYMIGAVAADDLGVPTVYQWLSENLTDEKIIIEEFNDFLKGFDTLIHFNGKTFDVPFIAEKCRKYDIPDIISGMESIDLLALMRPYKKLFCLPNLQQKTLERFSGLNRTDTFSGGELIPLYSQYAGLSSLVKLNPENTEYAKRCRSLEYVLLLHNYDDLCGMPMLGKMLGFRNLKDKASYETVSARFSEDSLLISATLSTDDFPSFRITCYGGTEFAVSGKKCSITIPVIHDEVLKFFFENYKDYYYLPQEDTAIHKSVAEFVDKEHRVKATRKNCYTKHSGTFAVCPDGGGFSLLRKNYEEKIFYTPVNQAFCEDESLIMNYVSALAACIFNS